LGRVAEHLVLAGAQVDVLGRCGLQGGDEAAVQRQVNQRDVVHGEEHRILAAQAEVLAGLGNFAQATRVTDRRPEDTCPWRGWSAVSSQVRMNARTGIRSVSTASMGCSRSGNLAANPARATAQRRNLRSVNPPSAVCTALAPDPPAWRAR